MARYTGPINKKARRYRYSVLETNKEFIKGKKRITVPGQHGASRQKLSGYGEHLYEKQKLGYMYGLTNKQLQNTFIKAKKVSGVLGHNLLFLLESRLDNIVYRMGIGSTRRQSRQFVTHGHILVNDKKIDIPSYIVNVNDLIKVKDKSRDNSFIKQNIVSLKGKNKLFVEFNDSKLEGKYLRLPNRDEIAGEIKEGLIVEFYNK